VGVWAKVLYLIYATVILISVVLLSLCFPSCRGAFRSGLGSLIRALLRRTCGQMRVVCFLNSFSKDVFFDIFHRIHTYLLIPSPSSSKGLEGQGHRCCEVLFFLDRWFPKI